MITREADYAFRIVDMLSRVRLGELAVSVKHIAEQTLVPYRFARKIVAELTRGGFLAASRGKFGGVRLAVDKSKLNAYEIIALIAPKTLVLNRCIKEPGSCERSGYCNVHEKLKKAQDEYEKLLRKIKI
jgi:Rrf2 family protein